MANEQERREMVDWRPARRSRSRSRRSQSEIGGQSRKGYIVKAVSQSVCFAAGDVAKHKNKIKIQIWLYRRPTNTKVKNEGLGGKREGRQRGMGSWSVASRVSGMECSTRSIPLVLGREVVFKEGA